LRDQLAERGVTFALGGKQQLVQQWLRKRGFVREGEDFSRVMRLFSTLEDAVDALAAAPDGAAASPSQGRPA